MQITPQTAKGSKKAEQKKNNQPVKFQKNVTLEIIDTLLIALILVFGIIRPLFLQTFFIPSESMVPLLHVKDKLIANKFIYHFRTPRRGEVIVFQPPSEAVIGSNTQLLQRIWLEKSSDAEISALNPNLANKREQVLASLPTVPTRFDDYIKRVIGVAGDRIHIVAGDGVYVNGKRLVEPYLSPDALSSMEDYPAVIEEPPLPLAISDPQVQEQLPLIRERLEKTTGKNYTDDEAYFALLPMGWLQKWYIYHYMYLTNIAPNCPNGEFVVPKDSVFVMGDNRGNSFDSRYWGVVPLNHVKARAVSTFWPLYYQGEFNLKLL